MLIWPFALPHCRCLERVLSVQHVAFKGGSSAELASAEEQWRVAAIVAEADHEGYWELASRDGNRKAHYTGWLLAGEGMGVFLSSGWLE